MSLLSSSICVNFESGGPLVHERDSLNPKPQTPNSQSRPQTQNPKLTIQTQNPKPLTLDMIPEPEMREAGVRGRGSRQSAAHTLAPTPFRHSTLHTRAPGVHTPIFRTRNAECAPAPIFSRISLLAPPLPAHATHEAGVRERGSTTFFQTPTSTPTVISNLAL